MALSKAYKAVFPRTCFAIAGDPAEARRRRLHAATFGDLEKLYLERHAVHRNRPPMMSAS